MTEYTPKELPQKYDHKEAEKRWQESWEAKGIHHWEEDQPRDNTFVIDTPPPTVSGVLHMGHIFSYTQADFIARYQRMSGKTVFYPMGFDDNGLPTERLVEKVKKIRATDLGREKFIEECESVAEEARRDFRALFQSIALSVDWNQEYHTISEDSRKISQLSLLDLYHKDKAYRKLQPMLWDPVDQTAIAQAEIEDKELPSHFNDIYFGIEGSDEQIIIGTTRPELIPACVAIFYHPEDERYQHLKDKQAITPLFGVKVPIMEDDTVEPDKGTGIMMCCTFGDEADIDKWQRHDLTTRVVINKYGKLDFSEIEEGLFAEIAPAEDLVKLKTSVARTKIIELLDQAGLLKESKPITHMVKCAERSGAPLEILLTYQWFVQVLDQKEQLKEKAATSTWHPAWMKTRVDQWIDGLSWDWCISRQRYFGVPFPIWYSKRAGEEGKILIASPDQLPVNPLVDTPEGYTCDEVKPEADVMDTWATSSVSPQLSSKAINGAYCLDVERHKKLFPADLRPQAHEIIRTWAFYTIVKAHFHEDSVPWHNLMISGWCLASDKTKMSKSKGNVVTPIDLIEEKGADAVRFWASTSKLGTDTAFSEDVLKIGKKLVTKLWNATKFAAIHLEKLDTAPPAASEDPVITETLDQWVLTRLHRAITKSTEEFEKYEYSNARAAIEDFFWNDFCDNYLELVKKRVYDEASENPTGQMSAVHTIYHCLNGILKLFAPFVPHVTEELYSYLFTHEYEQQGSLHARGTWPNASDYPLNETAEQSGIAGVAVLEAIRKLKSEKSLSIKYPIDVISITKGEEAILSLVGEDLKGAANAASLAFSSDADGDSTITEDERYTLKALFAAESDAA
jgi:valyl-tRNA synthetase